jgi:IS4 transposase
MKTRKIKNGKSSFKVLLCNNPNLCDRHILEMYALRWQVEIFFRELKSDLGAADFSGQHFDAFERYLDLILLSYLYLEWNRWQVIQKE